MKTLHGSGDGAFPRALLPKCGLPPPAIMTGVDFTSADKVFPHLNVLKETQDKQDHLGLL